MKYRDERVGAMLFGNTFRLCIRTYLVLASESSQFTSRSTDRVGEFMDAQRTFRRRSEQLTNYRTRAAHTLQVPTIITRGQTKAMRRTAIFN